MPSEPAREIGVALSGGGHRAALFGLGALLALVDLRLNRQVSYISSVSGGSITNAFIALNSRFEQATPADFEKTARKLTSVIVNQGILNRGTIVAIFLLLLVLLLAAALPFFYPLEFLPERQRLPFAAIVVIVALTLFLLRGLLLERILSKRILRNRDGDAARFRDIDAPNIE